MVTSTEAEVARHIDPALVSLRCELALLALRIAVLDTQIADAWLSMHPGNNTLH